jgi:hypothetical protein
MRSIPPMPIHSPPRAVIALVIVIDRSREPDDHEDEDVEEDLFA